MSIISINARSSIRIKGTKVVYFDPFKIAEERHDADFIFVTHEHYDHFSPEDIRKVSKEQTILVAPYSMKQVVCEQVGKIVKETIGVGVNEKAVLRFYQTALSFTSISIFPW